LRAEGHHVLRVRGPAAPPAATRPDPGPPAQPAEAAEDRPAAPATTGGGAVAGRDLTGPAPETAR
jgi:ABC-2 type transport system ATP-binding protein